MGDVGSPNLDPEQVSRQHSDITSSLNNGRNVAAGRSTGTGRGASSCSGRERSEVARWYQGLTFQALPWRPHGAQSASSCESEFVFLPILWVWVHLDVEISQRCKHLLPHTHTKSSGASRPSSLRPPGEANVTDTVQRRSIRRSAGWKKHTEAQ